MVTGCGIEPSSPSVVGDAGTDAVIASDSSVLAIEPAAITVPAGRDQIFVASSAASWSVIEPGGGTIESSGRYVAPNVPGTYHVVATANGSTAIATVVVAQMNLTVLAGGLGGDGNIDGVGDAARFEQLAGIVSDGNGTLYLADYRSVRAFEVATRRVTTIAGGGTGTDRDGIGTAAQLDWPWATAFDAATHTIYVAESTAIRAIDVTTRNVTTIAGVYTQSGTTDGPGTTARFGGIRGLCLVGTTLYIADSGANTIRTLDTSVDTHDVHLFAGEIGVVGLADSLDPLTATFREPMGLACTQTTLYLADYGNSAIRTIDRATGAVATLVGAPATAFGDGPFATAGVPMPVFLSLDPTGSTLYADDWPGGVIRALDLGAQTVTTIAGDPLHRGWTDGDEATARLWQPAGMVSDGQTLWFADRLDYELRSIALGSRIVTTLAGKVSGTTQGATNGALGEASFVRPTLLTTDGVGQLFVASDDTIRTISLATGIVTDRAGQPGLMGVVDGGPGLARVGDPLGLVVDPAGVLWQADGASVIRAIDADGAITTDFGAIGQRGTTDQVGTAARFYVPGGLAIVGNQMIVADLGNFTIRAIDRTTGTVTTLAGVAGVAGIDDGIGAAARFSGPFALATDGVGKVWVGDMATNGAAIREIDVATATVTTIAGDRSAHGSDDGVGANARFYMPYALAYDGAGSLFVVETADDEGGFGLALIRRIWIPSHAVSTYAGQPRTWGVSLGPLQTASLASPEGLALTPSGDLLVTGENAVLAIVRE